MNFDYHSFSENEAKLTKLKDMKSTRGSVYRIVLGGESVMMRFFDVTRASLMDLSTTHLS